MFAMMVCLRFSVVLALMRILIHNGLCTIATWLTVATLLNLADVLIYADSFGQSVAIQRGKWIVNSVP